MHKYFAEFFGTYCLVFAGTGAIVINDASGGAVTHLGIAITFGLIVTAMIYTLGNVSGSHLNPAVSIALCVARRFPSAQLAPYILAQLLGAILASATLRLLFPEHPSLGATLPAGTAAQSYVLEFLLTLILMVVILRVSAADAGLGIVAGLVIGAVIALEALFAGPICGASMNPFRSLAPALVSGKHEHLWIYLTAPVLGALSGVVCNTLLSPNPHTSAE